MTRTIKVSEVRPGMEVQFDLSGWDVKGTVATVDVRPHAVWIYTEKWCEMSLDLDSPVTVLSEPHPEEPTAFGARVVAGGYEFLLSHGGRRSWKARLDGKRYAWTDLCEMGSVAVIDATPSWTVPETPEVPERIEEWPEWDKHLRAYEWRDHDGRPWIYSRTHGRWYNFSRTAISKLVTDEPKFGPWTRATDA